MQIELKEKRHFTGIVNGQEINDLTAESEWEGMVKLLHPASGLHLIVLRDENRIVTGSPSLLESLKEPACEPGFIRVPARTLPNGRHVPSFQVAQYPCSVGADGKAYVSATEKPENNINYRTAMQAAANAGYQIERGSQALSIALDIANQDINWTGGKVGEGKIYQGIHKGNVSGPQVGNYESSDPEERSWHQLSNGERLYHYAGNLFTWLFDDFHGNDEGIVREKIPADSPYLTFPPYPSESKGMGYRPDGERNWSGRALVRGGCWGSESFAGVFRLDRGWPDGERAYVGFRCTKSS